MIELRDIKKTYGEGDSSHHALRGVNLSIAQGEIFGIIGSSGAGKSTLVRCINLLERPTEGRVIIDGTDVTDYQGSDLRKMRAEIGMIFQSFALFQQRTVARNIAFPLELRGVAKAERIKRASELLEVVGLAGLEKRYPSELSGGQQQRVAIARALADNPKIILCDEATSALDPNTSDAILDLLQKINADLGVTIVVITHSLEVAERICGRVAVLDAGLVAELGETREVFANPQSDAARSLLRGRA